MPRLHTSKHSKKKGQNSKHKKSKRAKPLPKFNQVTTSDGSLKSVVWEGSLTLVDKTCLCPAPVTIYHDGAGKPENCLSSLWPSELSVTTNCTREQLERERKQDTDPQELKICFKTWDGHSMRFVSESIPRLSNTGKVLLVAFPKIDRMMGIWIEFLSIDLVVDSSFVYSAVLFKHKFTTSPSDSFSLASLKQTLIDDVTQKITKIVPSTTPQESSTVSQSTSYAPSISRSVMIQAAYRVLFDAPSSRVLSGREHIRHTTAQMMAMSIQPDQNIISQPPPSLQAIPPQPTWEWEENGQWKPYDPVSSQVISAAFVNRINKPHVVIQPSRSRFKYDIHLDTLKQTNLTTGMVRNMRWGGGVNPMPAETIGNLTPTLPTTLPLLAIEPPENLDPEIEPEYGACVLSPKQKPNTWKEYRLKQAAYEFLRYYAPVKHEVVRVEFHRHKKLVDRYEARKKEFPNANEQWGFHGTSSKEVVQSIMKGGFKIGGVDDDVPIKNGKIYGNGVYLGLKANTSERYDKTSCQLILSLYLDIDLATSPNAYAVVKDKRDVLPVYVVHYQPSPQTNGNNTNSNATPSIYNIYNCTPRHPIAFSGTH